MNKDKDAVTSDLASKLDNIFLVSHFSENCQSIKDSVSSSLSTNESLHRLIEMANAILYANPESHNDPKIFIPIISAIIGASSAYSFNFFHWKMVERKKKESESLSMLSTLITEIETLTVDYWTKDQKNEVYIKSRIRLLTKYIRLINNKKSYKNISNDIDSFASDIFDLVTGDEFESKNRKASKPKAMSISLRCADIRAIISYFC